MFKDERPRQRVVASAPVLPEIGTLQPIRRFAMAALLFGSAGAAQAALVEDEVGQSWVFKRDLTSAQFATAFADYSDKGYLMTDIDAYPSGSSTRYSMLWRKNTDHRGWAEKRDLSSADFATAWNTYVGQGMRLVDVEAYPLNGQIRWAGIWVQNKENLNWSSHRGLTSADFSTLFQSKSNAGWRIVDIDIYNTSNGLRYNSIWQANPEQTPWAERRDMSREQYDAELAARSAAGFQLVDFESYSSPSGQSYAGIWEKGSGHAAQVRTDRTAQEFSNLWYQYLDEGYRLVDFERYETPDGTRYGGIWRENDERFRYSKKANLDSAITSYRNLNNLPGISVVVIQNGKTLYRRGFGFADVAGNKTANASTVYAAASISKIYGGVLAAKLEQDQELHDGTALSSSLDLDNLSSSYLPGLPSQHKHRVRELLSHLSCVPHYNTNPGIADQTSHYSSATAALQSIKNSANIVGCTPNTSWNYSTHAFTYVGAVLEQVSGRGINQLLEDELFTPYGLSSTRVMYESAALPSNSLRAVPYTVRDPIGTAGQVGFDPPNAVNNPNVASSYTDSSWKVLGGGLETNTLDLASFGWKVLHGDIVSADTRDNRLWTRVNPSFSHGLAWAVGTTGSGQRVADWNGSWTGSRTWLRAYRDDGTVIAIMSNRTNHTLQDIGNLSNSIAAIVIPASP
ncbi:serine hydrolase [Permianibacter sp. IMCC34836]|uniref:serine hydrolase n=1 Tax=Permianibacter fluminis TaxID=2738515 RepID=UPI0015568A5C|nr:serine hydrolase [Permianibacter fluminis]NQD35949.1 serine hydrolase [Permianibacter fluminis]